MALVIIDLKARLKDSMMGVETPIQTDRGIFRKGILQKMKNKNKKLETLLEDEDVANTLDWLVEAVAEAIAEAVADEVIYDLRTNAEVAFIAGDIAGADSNAATHELLTASGGTVS